MYVNTSQNGMSGLGQTTSAVKSQIVAAAQQYGVDPNLALAVAQQESGFQQTGSSGSTLKSSAGALGVMQLMPATAAGLGVDPNDQQQNISGGVKLLSQLLNQFGGNSSEALAAYNAGPAAVTKYGGVPPYAETQNYVSSILANYQSMGGSAAASIPSSDPSSPDYSAPDPTASSFLDSLANAVSLNADYNLGGVVLTGADLAALGIAVVAIFVVWDIL